MFFGIVYGLPPVIGLTDTLSLMVFLCFTTVPMSFPDITINLLSVFGPNAAMELTGKRPRDGIDALLVYSISTVVGCPSLSNGSVSGLSVFNILPNRLFNVDCPSTIVNLIHILYVFRASTTRGWKSQFIVPAVHH